MKACARASRALAIAGGIHLNLADETAMLEREFGAVSASGHTYAFDGRADGYVRGEGGGLVLLKPLRAALEDGDRIRAVIRGSAVGNAGHSAAGQTVPSARRQADVIRRALSRAGLDSQRHRLHRGPWHRDRDRRRRSRRGRWVRFSPSANIVR